MKKIAALIAVVLLLGACATGKEQITSLSSKKLAAMSATEIVEFYANDNKRLLDRIVYNRGGQVYDDANRVLETMNKELSVMSRTRIAKAGFDARVQSMVTKYQSKLDEAIKMNEN
ncbi:hypothetical protein Dip518_001452 [Parelusimicrobium proximum]|uniref:hypothetical protein n=1 Tax=Parelusimicrobium proximum TaxID=3228953 RepID=UPI003D1689E5